MARREYLIRLACDAEGCREGTVSVASSRKEEAEARARYARHPWRCCRHRAPEEVLSSDNAERIAVLVAGKSKSYPHLSGLYWDGEGNRYGGQGIVSGPGFKAIADDFPPGTKLIVTARIALPEDGQ